MEGPATLTFIIVMLSPLIALFVAGTYYRQFAERYRHATRGAKPLGRFIGGILLYGVTLGFLGLVLGIVGSCAAAPSAQCGLGGYFLTGPLFFSGGVGLFLYRSLRRASAP